MSELIQQNEYHPDSVSPPGETIGETLILRNMTRRAFADAMHYGEATIYRLLNGQKRITLAVALQLEKVLDVPAEFWLNREAAYSASIGRKVSNPIMAQNFLSTKRKGNTLNIYLAGGMRTAWRDQVRESLPAGINWFDPMQHGLIDPVEYTRWDLEHVEQSDLVFAYMSKDNPSGIGLALEVGYAVGKGIPVILVNEAENKYMEIVEQAADSYWYSLRRGIHALRDWLRDKKYLANQSDQ